MVMVGSSTQEENESEQKGKNTFAMMVECLSHIGNKLLNNDP